MTTLRKEGLTMSIPDPVPAALPRYLTIRQVAALLQCFPSCAAPLPADPPGCPPATVPPKDHPQPVQARPASAPAGPRAAKTPVGPGGRADCAGTSGRGLTGKTRPSHSPGPGAGVK